MRTVRCAIGDTRRSLWAGLLALLCSLCVSHVYAQSAPLSTRWDIAVEGRVGLPGGYVKVGEHDIPGTRLRLHDDLGIDLSKAAQLQLGYHLTPQDTIRFSFLTLFLDGTTTLPHNVFFNGSTLLGGTRLDTSPDFYQITLAYERTLLPLPGGTLLGSAGLTYVHLNFVLHGTEVTSVGGEKQPEDFWRQELPVPMVGLRADYPLTPRLGLSASLAGGYLPWVDSLRSEGGRVKLTQSHLDGSLGLRYALTSLLSVTGGYRFTHFMQFEKSHEDDNRIHLLDNTLSLGLNLRF